MNDTIKRLEQARLAVEADFPEAKSGVSVNGLGRWMDLTFHGCDSYPEAEQLLRRLGVTQWECDGGTDENGFLQGYLSNDHEVTVFYKRLALVSATETITMPTDETKNKVLQGAV